jgi:hypothetical protein
MFHSAYPLRQGKFKVKEKLVEKNSDTSSLAVPTFVFLINLGKVMENVLFWCYTA